MSVEYLTNLPDMLFYKILSYLADTPLDIGSLLGLSIAPLCSSINDYVQSDSIWELILREHCRVIDTCSLFSSSSRTSNSSQNTRRRSKRLRRTTAKEDVMHAFTLRRANTDMALQEFSDLAITKKPHPLTLARLRGIIRTYGPDLNFDQRSVLGTTFLVETCRARYVKESVILACVRELVRKHGASTNVPAIEGVWEASHGDQRRKLKYLTPLVVAAARGMPSVVRYLVGGEGGASVEAEGTSRFRLYMNSMRSVAGTFTALGFARAMLEAEMENGATEEDVKSLNVCIQILVEKAQR